MTKHEFLSIYRDVVQINKGGTGFIYRAHHRNLDKDVVLKSISSVHDIRFIRHEVDILKNLKHRYLPTIYDFIEVDGTNYIVEDYIEGYDLNRLIDGKVFVPENYVVKWLKQMCEVLDYLHSRTPAVIHSDIKPGNIMIDASGDICLIDFNISVLRDGSASVLGFSNYFCAPEQLENAMNPQCRKPIDVRTDIYSTSATFYALMSGVVPHVGEHHTPLAQMGLAYRDGLMRLIEKGMANDPKNRWQSAKQMLSHLDRVTNPNQRQTKLITAAVLIAVVVIAAASLAIGLQSHSNAVSQYRSQLNEIDQRFEEEGATDELFHDVNAFMAESFNKKMLQKDSVTQAHLYAIMAESKFIFNDETALLNAQNYYGNAWELIKSSMEDRRSERESIAASYATVLALNGERELAEALVEEQFSDNGPVAVAVKAGLAYQASDYATALAEASALADGRNEMEARLSVCRLAAKAAEYQRDTQAVLNWTEKLITLSPDDDSYRFAAICLVNQQNQSLYATAIRYFSKIKAPRPSDLVDHAETLALAGEYQSCITVLQKKNQNDPLLKVRAFGIYSFAYYGLNQISNAKAYFNKAVESYESLTEKQKKELSETTATISNLRELSGCLNIQIDF